jgi:ABC-type glycerol-3-phosphate transport system permease component
MIMTLDQFKTLMPSLQSFYGRMLGQGTRWDYIYAFIVLCILPIIVLFYLTSRHIIRGVIDGALKG